MSDHPVDLRQAVELCNDMKADERARALPVCCWCLKTEAEHKPASEPNRVRYRMPCLGWRENFVPDDQLVTSATQRPSVAPPLLSALTDAQRLAVLHEIYAEMRGSGGSTQVALERYEEKVKGRLR